MTLEEATTATSILDQLAPLIIVVSRDEVERKDIAGPLTTLRWLVSSVDIIRQFRKRVDISFHGYNNTTDELWEISAVRDYVSALDMQFPFWLYFLSRHFLGLQCVGFCMLPPFLTEEGRRRIHIDMLNDILAARWQPALVRLCNSAGLADSVADELAKSANEYFVHGPLQAAGNT
jgi:hypothetical protein